MDGSKSGKTMDTVLNVKNLGVAYNGEWVFRSLNIAVARGERIALLGSSGCGKTTFLRAAAGLSSPSEGERTLSASRLGYVFQEPRLIPWLSVRRNLAFVSERDPSEILAALKLSNMADALPHELSGGMKQRVNLARALLAEPELLLLDEAFSSLDVALKLRIFSDFNFLWSQKRFASIMVTHDPRDALITADRILLLGGTPTGILQTIDVSLPFERDYTSLHLTGLETRILKILSADSPEIRR